LSNNKAGGQGFGGGAQGKVKTQKIRGAEVLVGTMGGEGNGKKSVGGGEEKNRQIGGGRKGPRTGHKKNQKDIKAAPNVEGLKKKKVGNETVKV